MARHRLNRPRRGHRLSASFGVLTAVAAVTTVAAPSHAALQLPSDKTVTASNDDVISHCHFQVNKVHPSTVSGKLSLYASPHQLAGYLNNRYTAVQCYLMPGGVSDRSQAVATLSTSANAATVSDSSLITVPPETSYTLCAQATVTLKDGTTSTTPYVCG
ncbi:MAG: hypothetical protein FWE71_10345 [Nocardioidaceae bacterium]|nr:hypothetical protein [Nocardioidaceae bacterium]MCL2614869.1 hypothetical protein [Nocardioidaceae bacterium]